MQSANKLRIQGMIMLGFLIGQYVLGMLTNLYVKFPENKTNYQQWQYANGQLLIGLHIILGVLLLIGSIVLLVRAIRMKDRVWRVAATIGLGSILLAVISGSEFISTQNHAYSLIMSALFVSSVAAYGWGLYKTKI